MKVLIVPLIAPAHRHLRIPFTEETKVSSLPSQECLLPVRETGLERRLQRAPAPGVSSYISDVNFIPGHSSN